MHLEETKIIEHHDLAAGYRLLVLAAPRIAPEVQPGQFVHVRIPHLETALLRRPFSVYRTDGDTLALLYKAVGRGTRALSEAKPGETISLMGPLGRGFPSPAAGRFPVLVAGGYGSAALYMLARSLPMRGVVFIGARTQSDILCPEAFEALRWDVRIATEDGSRGFRGLVTQALERWLETELGLAPPEFFACGPNAMLRKVADMARERSCRAWLSMDRNMGCGVGACLTCVQRIRSDDGGWHWERCCKDGPVFEASKVVWDAEDKGDA